MTREEKLEQFAIEILESQWAMGEKDAMDLIVKAEDLELNELAKEFRKLLAEEDPKDDLKHDLYNALNPNNL
jgi:hypothetical protein